MTAVAGSNRVNLMVLDTLGGTHNRVNVLLVQPEEEALLNYADLSSPYHDGFHLLSLDGRLTHLAQYFAPPIVRDLPPHGEAHQHGGRYRAAQYGSCLREVAASGVLTHHYGPVLFVDGVPHFSL